MRLFLEDFCADSGVSRTSCLRLNLVLEELFTNTVHHGHRGDSDAPVWLTLASLQRRVAVTYEDTAPPFNPYARVREPGERFVHALATLDAEAIFDGGWMLPLGQEESLTDLVAAYRRLPAGKFDQHPDSVLPITIRSQVVGNTNYTYFVNDSAWPMTLQVDVVAPAGTRVDELSGRRRLPALTSVWRDLTTTET